LTFPIVLYILVVSLPSLIWWGYLLLRGDELSSLLELLGELAVIAILWSAAFGATIATGFLYVPYLVVATAFALAVALICYMTYKFGAKPVIADVGEITILEISIPKIKSLMPVPRLPFPIDGWVGVKVHNGTNVEYNGCTGEIITDIGKYDLSDWLKYLRDDFWGGAEPYKSFMLERHSTKIFHSKIQSNTKEIEVSLDIGARTFTKRLNIPI
jgi:hypothetical protein